MKKNLYFLCILVLLVCMIGFIGCGDSGGDDDDDDSLGVNQFRITYANEIFVSDITDDEVVARGIFASEGFLFDDIETVEYEIEFACFGGEYYFTYTYDSGTDWVEVWIDDLENLSSIPGNYSYSSDLVTYNHSTPGYYETSADPGNEIATTITIEFNLVPDDMPLCVLLNIDESMDLPDLEGDVSYYFEFTTVTSGVHTISLTASTVDMAWTLYDNDLNVIIECNNFPDTRAETRVTPSLDADTLYYIFIREQDDIDGSCTILVAGP